MDDMGISFSDMNNALARKRRKDRATAAEEKGVASGTGDYWVDLFEELRPFRDRLLPWLTKK